jgi:hypothetical protein
MTPGTSPRLVHRQPESMIPVDRLDMDAMFDVAAIPEIHPA